MFLRRVDTGRRGSSSLLAKLRAARLTPRQIECLSLYYFDGMSQEDIGVELDLSQQAVCQHLSSGCRRLRRVHLEPKPPTHEPEPIITHMAIEKLDALSPSLTRHVW